MPLPNPRRGAEECRDWFVGVCHGMNPSPTIDLTAAPGAAHSLDDHRAVPRRHARGRNIMPRRMRRENLRLRSGRGAPAAWTAPLGPKRGVWDRGPWISANATTRDSTAASPASGVPGAWPVSARSGQLRHHPRHVPRRQDRIWSLLVFSFVFHPMSDLRQESRKTNGPRRSTASTPLFRKYEAQGRLVSPSRRPAARFAVDGYLAPARTQSI